MRTRTRGVRSGRLMLAIGLVLLLAVVLLAILAPWIAPFSPTEQRVGPRLDPPGAEHWLGTDRLGRDTFSRVLHGGRLTLLFTALTMAGIVVIGLAAGIGLGIAWPRLDDLGRKVIVTAVAFPAVVVILAFVGFNGPSLVSVLGGALLVWWAPFARLTRSLVRSALAEGSAVASRAMGASRLVLLRREVLPRLWGPLGVLTAVECGQLIAVVAGLSFLGMGAQPPNPEWGAMLNEARGLALVYPWLVVAPGGAVLLAALALTLIGDGLRDVSDGARQEVSA